MTNLILLNKERTNLNFDTINQLGQITLDEQRIVRLKNLLQKLLVEDTTILNIVARKLATFGYETNINYHSLDNLFDDLELNKNILHDVYVSYNTHASVFSLKESINNPKKNVGLGLRELETLENRIHTTFYLANNGSYPYCKLSNKEDITLKRDKGTVTKSTYKDEDRTQFLTDKELLRCCPTHVNVYSNPDDSLEVSYDWEFIRMIDKKLIKIKEVSLSETASKINEMGMSANNRETFDTLAHCLVALAESSENLYTERERYVKKGFAYNPKTNKIDIEQYELVNPKLEDTKKALLLFNEYLHEFKTDNEKLYLVTNFKWGLISPFIFAKKQMDKSTKNLIPYPYLMGIGNTGKTTAHGDMVLSMWYDDISEGEVGGGRVETIPQIGYEVEESTLPKVFDEAGTIFENEFDKRSRDRLKDLINRITFRHTRNKEGREFRSINSFIITSNGEIHDTQTGVTRRLLLQNFTDAEVKSVEEISKFNQKYNIGEPDNRLYQLKNVSHLFARHIIANPSLLLDNWMNVVDDFVTDVYNKCDVTKPKILNNWIKAREISIDEEKQRELETVTHAFKSKVVENKRFIREVNDNPYDFVQLCILNGINGLDIVVQGEETNVLVTRGFLNELYKKKRITKEYNLNDFCHRFGWQYYKNRNNVYGKIEYNKFVAWLYPNHALLK